MATPNEVFDDVTAQATNVNTTFKISKPPYELGSVKVFRNGLLQDPDFFTETDPANGLVEVCEPIEVSPDDDHNITIAYCTFVPIFVDPEIPVHISQLAPGNVVRIAMKPGRHLEPILMPKTKQMRLQPGRAPHGRSLRAKGYSRTVFLGLITQNDFVSGKLTLQVEDRQFCRTHLEALVPYKDILVIRKYITPGEGSNTPTNTIGGGPRAGKRPGVVAKGAFDPSGFMKLIKVFF